ncbi:MAG: DUF2156 domain-containing protein [Ornithinimicrobium sp.]|uniref:bifunctional lysylphosphatidylglycerol flippase/synthetase MprF n=1 Tax=Ornithinimicrobium sp. TaxID=1977084 RepID=UPI0026DF6107|nr:DUF2156 domain-containing protein [Ornithinimicrobium sp.]MDO5740171.1 DUF2156 domain-containing protein [Ornithinimicrobium sp.]
MPERSGRAAIPPESEPLTPARWAWPARAGHAVVRAPVSVGLAVLVTVVALLGARASEWLEPAVVQDLGLTGPEVVTSLLSSSNAWSAALAVIALLTVGIAAERAMGTLRYAVTGLLGSVTSMLVTVALCHGIARLDPGWGQHLLTAPMGSPWVWLAVTGLAASVRLPTMWRRRAWAAIFVVLGVVVLFAGEPGDLAALVSALLGLLAGALQWPDRVRRGPVVGSRSEVRVLIATAVAGVVVGTVLSLGSTHLVGPLSATRFVFAQASYDANQVAAICADANRGRECVRATYVLKSAGVGALVLAMLPLLIQLVLAEGLRRGRWAAMVGTVALNLLLAGLAAAHAALLSWHQEPWILGRHLDLDLSPWPGARLGVPILVPALLVLLVLLNRRAFRVRAAPGTYLRFWWRVGLSVLAVLLAIVLGGAVVADQFVPRATFSGLLGDGLVALLPSPALTVLTPLLLPEGEIAKVLLEWLPIIPWLVAAVLLFSAQRTVSARTESREHYRELVRAVAPRTATLAWIGSWQGRRIWTSPTCRAAVAYQAHGGVALTVADPVCAEQDLAQVVREFAQFCAEHSWVPALYSVHAPTADQTEALGWFRVQVAEETVLELTNLTFSGKAFQDVRTAMNRATKEGVTSTWTTWAEASLRTRAQISAISEEWVADKALPEMEFTLGGLAELDDPEVRLLLAQDADAVVQGVTSWLPIYADGAKTGLTLDFMRRREGGFRPVMEFLIARAALDAKADGLRVLSLSGAPLARAPQADVDPPGPEQPPEAAPVAPEDETLVQLLDLLGRILEPAYGFRSLHAFKAKFGPTYAPMYLCFPDPADLAVVGRAVAQAYLPEMSLSGLLRVGRTLVRGPS